MRCQIGIREMSYLDLSDLPKELLKELKFNLPPQKRDRLILRLIKRNETMTVDELLIALWRRDSIVYKRRAVVASIGRLKKSGQIKRCGDVEGDTRMGIYKATTSESHNATPTQHETATLAENTDETDS